MKGFTTVLASLFLFSSLAEAGWGWNKDRFQSAKSSMVEQRVTSPSYCFDSGFDFSLYMSGYWPDGGPRNNQLGGGGALSYFFGHNLGVEASYAAHGGFRSEQVGTFNLVYRFPLGGECCSTIAPYVFGGPGVLSAGPSEFLWNVGGGIDFRLESWGCTGLFADFSYHFVNHNLPDFTMIRTGIRFPF